MPFKSKPLTQKPAWNSSCRSWSSFQVSAHLTGSNVGSLDANRGAKPKPLCDNPFIYDPQTPNGNVALNQTVRTQHMLIKKSKAVVNTWEGQETKELRHIRTSKPAYKMNAHDRHQHQKKLELMEKTQELAKASVDCHLPKDAWHFRQVLEKSRKRSLDSKANQDSGAYQVNWSSQMQDQGLRYLARHREVCQAGSSVGSIEFDNKISSEVLRFQANMATALERGQTVANNKIDVKLPGEGSFEVPEKNKGSTGFSWGPHIAKPTGSHGGLSHVQKQAQAQSWAMRAKNKPKSVIKNSGVNKNMLDQEGFEAQIRRMVMDQAMNTASSADVQANYLKDCDNWAPPSPRVKVEELRTLDQPPRRCMATSAYKAKCSSEHSILQGEEVFAIKVDPADAEMVIVFNNKGLIGSVPYKILNFSDGPQELTDQEILAVYAKEHQEAADKRRASEAIKSGGWFGTNTQQGSRSFKSDSPLKSTLKQRTVASRPSSALFKSMKRSDIGSVSRSPMADKLCGTAQRPATAQSSHFKRNGSKHLSHMKLKDNKKGGQKLASTPHTPRDTWLAFTVADAN